MSMTDSEAKLKLAVLNASALEMSRVDFITQLTNSDIPQEIITRIDGLWEQTKVIGGQVIQVGKIIVIEIMKFVKENTHLALGVALGAAIGALVSIVPFFGPFLAPLATAISILVGGIAGYRIDQGQEQSAGLVGKAQEMIGEVVGVTQDIVAVAKKFFELFANIFNILQAQFA